MTTFGDALCVMIDRTLLTKKLQRCIRTERISVEDAPLLSGVPDLVHQGIIDDRSKYLPLTFHHAENIYCTGTIATSGSRTFPTKAAYVTFYLAGKSSQFLKS